MSNEPKRRWCVWNRDSLCLIGPDIAENDFDSLSDAFEYVADCIRDGMGQEYDVAMGRFSRRAEGFVPAGKPISIDARDADDIGEDDE